jgi:tetratricopeptide (TPR) repeat protein
VLLLVVYGPSLQNRFTGYDDTGFITESTLVTDPWPGSIAKAFTHTSAYLYIPLTIVSWQMNAHILGLDPFWFHLTDLVIHALNTFLVFWIFQRITKKDWPSLFAALIFAVHPLNVEAVAWAASRKDILCAFFALLSFSSYLNFTESGEKKWLTWTFVLYVLGLFTKVAILPLPFMFLVYDWFEGRPIKDFRMWKEKLWFLLPMAVFATVAVYGGSPFLAPLATSTVLLLGAKALTILLGLFFWPNILTAFHYQMVEPTLYNTQFFLATLFFAGLCIAVVVAAVLYRCKAFVFGMIWMLLFLLPTFQTALKAGLLITTSEKYFYLPAIGLLFFLLTVILKTSDRFPKMHRVWIPFSFVVIVALGFRSAVYAVKWRDGTTLYKSVLEHDPTNSIAKGSLAVELNNGRQSEEAVRLLKESLMEDPNNAVNYMNLAGIYYKKGQIKEAKEVLTEMLVHLQDRQVQGDEGLRKMLVLASDLADRFGDAELAIRILESGVKHAPMSPELLSALGIRLLNRNQTEEAYSILIQAADAGSTDVNVYYHLAEFYSKNGSTAELKKMLQKSIELNPQNEKAKEMLKTLP